MAERAGVTRATVTGLLDGLERDGFLRREADEVDRRRVRVLLSAKGSAIATKLFAEHTQWIGGLFEALSPERKRLGELLGKVWRATDSAARVAGGGAMKEGSQDARRRTRRAGHQPGATRSWTPRAGVNLTECLAVDFAALMAVAVPQAGADAARHARGVGAGHFRRMAQPAP